MERDGAFSDFVDIEAANYYQNWIFCVDNKNFTTALFEYYLDHFSSQRTSQETATESNDAPRPPEEGEYTDDDNLPKDTVSSGPKVPNHPHAWTLEPIAMYGERISRVIDRDESGFIRISEVNSFTDRMPKGWSLPQWCAYAAVGTSDLVGNITIPLTRTLGFRMDV